jgi:seryl-tRNA(Sec) selenium transferase
MGVDLFCFSGGKGLCGPQCSGLLLGRKDLIVGRRLREILNTARKGTKA